MRKFLLTLATLVSTLAASAQTIYSTDFSTKEDFEKWTVVDANGDGYTWQFNADATTSHVFYSYSSLNSANDWLISPAIVPEKTGLLLVKYVASGSSLGENYDVYTGSKPEVKSLTELQGRYLRVLGQRTGAYFCVNATAGVPIYVGIRCTSLADKYRLYMCNFSVQYANKMIDLKASNLSSPVRSDQLTNSEEVKVDVENIGKETSNAFKMAYQIDGGTPVIEDVNATLAPGAKMTYTFKTKADLSIPRHNYSFKVYPIDPDDVNNENDTCTTVVRHDGELVPPCSWGFEPSEDNAQFKSYNLNNDGGRWFLYADPWYNFARTGTTCLAYNYDKEHDGDDWAVLDPIKVEAGNYVLRYWYSGSDGHTEKLGVYYGNGDTPADMTQKIDELEATQGEYKETFKVINIDKPQTIYLGFYCHSDKNENWITIDDVQFYKASSDNVDLVASSISKPFDYARTPNNKDVVFEVRNIGIKNANSKVVVSIDGVAKKTFDCPLVAQEIKTVTAENVLDGVEPGKHSIKVAIESDEDKTPDNNVVEKDFVMLGTPVKLYDMEDGKRPEDFTFYVGDEGTVNEDAGVEFNEEGWGIFNLQEHAMLGEHVLAGTSWIDNATPDRWAILPQVKVTGDNAYFAWDANSFNPTLLEDYNVKVSDGSGNPADYWYSTEAKVTYESTVPKTRGINLAKYKDKEIYIGFNLVTKKGEALCLDNIGLYGDVEFTGNKFVTGIKEVNADAKGLIVFDNDEIGAEGAQSVVVYDMAGRTVTSVAGSKANVSSLTPGVYVGVVKYANAKSESIKFVKK